MSADALMGIAAAPAAKQVRERIPSCGSPTETRPAAEELSPELRQLVRRLRKSTPKTLRLLSAVAAIGLAAKR